MNWKSHLIVSSIFIILTTILVIYLSDDNILRGISVFEFIAGIGIAYYCALLPDIDIKTSKVFSFTLIVCLLAIIYFATSEGYIEIIAIVGFIVVIMFFDHRGIMHKWYTAIPIAIIALFASMSIVVALYAFVGYISHAGIEKSKD